jgi:hypothetical protein
VTYSYDWSLEQRGEYQHLTLRDPEAAVKPSRAHIHLSNLFDGDKFLGKWHPPTRISPSSIVNVMGWVSGEYLDLRERERNRRMEITT